MIVRSFVLLIAYSLVSSVFAAVPRVLLLGDEVLMACRSEVLNLTQGRAECSFVEMPKTGRPDWPAFCKEHVYGKGYNVIHFSFGRELMAHEDGVPRGKEGDTWGIYIDLIRSLKESGAFLVGCTTTPVRGCMPGYDGRTDWLYSSRFKQMLGPQGVKINDLADYTSTRLDEMVQNNSYLPTKLGRQLMAEQMANAVFEALNEGQDSARPRILLVGDSIVGGYYSATRDLFAGQAVVYSGGTTYNDAHPDWKKIVDEYIEKGGGQGWDVIQFNWGLHAMKHVGEGNRTLNADLPGARVQFPPPDYIRELELFVKELKRTGAKLVFATTTPIPEDCTGSIVRLDQAAYNEPAKELMKREGIIINDLYAFSLPQLKEIQLPRNVHFTSEGSARLAERNHAVLAPLLKSSNPRK